MSHHKTSTAQWRQSKAVQHLGRRLRAPIKAQHCQQPLPYRGQERTRPQQCFLQQLCGWLPLLLSINLVQAIMHLSGGHSPDLQGSSYMHEPPLRHAAIYKLHLD